MGEGWAIGGASTLIQRKAGPDPQAQNAPMTRDPVSAAPISLALAEAKVPRYTSYPTAAQFGPLEEATYLGWLREGIGPGDPLSLYVHVPFCRDLCWYCGCHTRATRSESRLAAYAVGLWAELALLARALPPHGGLAHLHLGGGTPSILGARELTSLVVALGERLGFRPGAELAIELDPRHLDEALAEGLATAGFNRASLGVQDIAPEVQARIGRPQPPDLVEAAVTRLRRAGIGALNLDLMYGLPGQTTTHVAASARFAAELGASRVAVFGYAHVPWMKPNQAAIETAALPGAAARLEQALTAEEVLLAAGYQAVGLDHYARPDDPLAVAARDGRMRRNFQGYTTDSAPALLGLGASAIAQLPAGQAQNDADERRWLAAVATGRLPIVRGRWTTAEDRLRWRMIERVLCDLALDLSQEAWGEEATAVLSAARPGLEALREAGVVTIEGPALQVTGPGRRFVRLVAACFDAYLLQATVRHSAAV
jgi:oxygen-independent coproporphyrinogen-3 oxidase